MTHMNVLMLISFRVWCHIPKEFNCIQFLFVYAFVNICPFDCHTKQNVQLHGVYSQTKFFKTIPWKTIGHGTKL